MDLVTNFKNSAFMFIVLRLQQAIWIQVNLSLLESSSRSIMARTGGAVTDVCAHAVSSLHLHLAAETGTLGSELAMKKGDGTTTFLLGPTPAGIYCINSNVNPIVCIKAD